MTKTLEHVRVCLADFKRREGREPSTIEDYREISNSAKRMALMEAALDEVEITVPTYFGVQEMEA